MSSLATIPAINWTTLVLRYANANTVQALIGPWRPPQFNQPQIYSLTVAETTTTFVQSKVVQTQQTTPGTVRQKTQSITYFFDAILRAEHRQSMQITQHPIQSGASVVDHAFLRPARLVLEIGISDAMASFVGGQYTSAGSRSISAYQTFKTIMASRLPLSLTTRLDTYQTMLIEEMVAVEDARTSHALRVQVIFAQIILANTATLTVPASARPDQTNSTNEGIKQPIPPVASLSNTPGVGSFPGTADITAGGLFPELKKSW